MKAIALNYQNLIKISFRPNMGNFWVIGMSLIIFFSVLYVIQINLMTTETYLIQSGQKKMNELIGENKGLEVYFAQANSFSSLEAKVSNLSLEKVGEIHYIQALDGQVVTNR